ncbi:MAG: hypothetical protein FWD49_05575 [Firmicutes bacterium]|nr:hypothetical protein [Bacillota bacterium]
MKFALIGEKLKHSYSAEIHGNFGYDYLLEEISHENLERFVKNNEYGGFNVTIPYKKAVIPFLDMLDETAVLAGAVNTVKKTDRGLIGHNTDIAGLKYLADSADIDFKDKFVLILGTGGASESAVALAKAEGAKSVVKVGRNGENNYENIAKNSGAEIIINATPFGMYPLNNVSDKLIDLSIFKNLKAVIDMIYNPLKTNLILQAESLKIKAVSGLKMLIAQAKYARDIFIGEKIPNGIIEDIYRNLLKRTQNIALIGMPCSGKSTVGKSLATALNKHFLDTDEVIKTAEGISISEIFESKGETFFRECEARAVADIGAKTGQVIATGGGAVLNPQNMDNLKQNGIIILIERDIKRADGAGRPLLKDTESIKRLHEERAPLYKKYADFTVDNNGNINKTVKEIKDYLEKN